MHFLSPFYPSQEVAPFLTAFTLCSSQEPLQMKEKLVSRNRHSN